MSRRSAAGAQLPFLSVDSVLTGIELRGAWFHHGERARFFQQSREPLRLRLNAAGKAAPGRYRDRPVGELAHDCGGGSDIEMPLD
jgi:hypothetical protein